MALVNDSLVVQMRDCAGGTCSLRRLEARRMDLWWQRIWRLGCSDCRRAHFLVVPSCVLAGCCGANLVDVLYDSRPVARILPDSCRIMLASVIDQQRWRPRQRLLCALVAILIESFVVTRMIGRRKTVAMRKVMDDVGPRMDQMVCIAILDCELIVILQVFDHLAVL